MNMTKVVQKLLTQFRPAEVETVTKSRKHPNGKIRRERPATVIMRRPYYAADGSRADFTIAELLDAKIKADGLTFNLAPGQSPVAYVLRQAEIEGVIRLKRDKHGIIVTRPKSDIPSGAWLATDYRPRKAKRSKAEMEDLRKSLLLGTLASMDLLDDDEADDDGAFEGENGDLIVPGPQ